MNVTDRFYVSFISYNLVLRVCFYGEMALMCVTRFCHSMLFTVICLCGTKFAFLCYRRNAVAKKAVVEKKKSGLPYLFGLRIFSAFCLFLTFILFLLSRPINYETLRNGWVTGEARNKNAKKEK